jgi:cation diffusion facilitator family transporter
LDTATKKSLTQRVTIVGAIVDFTLAIFKIFVGILGNSGALIADGVHSFSDLLTDGVVLYAAKFSHEEADDEHPYGHQRFETIATFVLAFFLALVGFGIIYDGYSRFINPEPLEHISLLLWTAALSVIAKEILYWYTVSVGKKVNSKMLIANAWHHRTDSLSSVVVFAGVIGVNFGYMKLDAIAAIIVGLMILYIAWKLGFDSSKELVDSSIDQKDIDTLYASIGKIGGVVSVHSLRTRRIGSNISADVHVQVEPYLSVSEGHIISVSVERVAMNCLKNLTDVIIHIDPEDDEVAAPYDKLPERPEALGILNKALFNEKCDGQIHHIQLHYLDGKIHVDFFLPLSCLKKKNSHQEIKNKLTSTVSELKGFGNVRVYFSEI